MELKLDNVKEISRLMDHAPQYDIAKLTETTKKDPKWVAFGTGNIFRVYLARIGQDLIHAGEFDRGIVVVESRSHTAVDTVYTPNDNLAISVTLKVSGDFESTLIGNISEVVFLHQELDRVKEIFRNPGLQIVSYTITEKGYDIYNHEGNLSDQVEKDLQHDPLDSNHLMVASVGLLHERFRQDLPVTMLSIDNLAKNGDVLKKAILTIAQKYVEKGRFDQTFLDYLQDEKKVTFPWSMIDKITPGPDEKVAKYLKDKGLEDLGPYSRKKGAPLAKYVNSEEAEYLAIEDRFANGRPDFSKVGVYLVDRKTVDKIETMKVTACLNPLHTTLAVYGCLLGYDRIYEEMKDPDLVSLITRLAYDEALPVVENPGVIDPKDFVQEVIHVRFPNPFMPDSPQRIATDTSLKVPVRFGKTLSTYVAKGKVLADLTYIPLALAGWLRYLLGINDEGKVFDLSPDPNLEKLQADLAGIKLGQFKVTVGLKELLSNAKFFGIDLVKIGLADKVIAYLEELCQGPGAVRKTLEKYRK